MMTEKELDQYLAEYGGMVRTVCRGILPGRAEDAEEAESDTFLKLWRCKNLPKESVHLRSYIIRTARCCAIDKYRSIVRQGITFSLDEREDAAFAAGLESGLESRELMDTIMSLPPPEGEIFLRRYLYGETAGILAEHFGMPESTVRTKLHRAKGKLKKILKKEELV